MPYLYSDSFTDVNGTTLQAHVPDSVVPFVWTQLGANLVTVLNNRLSFPAAGAASRYRANVNALNDDGDYELTGYIVVAGANASISVGLCLVIPGTVNGYRAVLSKDISGNLSFGIGRLTSGAYSSLGTSGTLPNPADGIHEMRIVRSGNNFTLYWQGALLLTAVDATHAGVSQIAIDGNSDADNSYVLGAFAAGIFDPIEVFPDPADATLDCVDDRRAEFNFVEPFTGNAINLENYVEPAGNWGTGLPDYTPGGIWVITTNKMREAILNFSFQRPVNEAGISFTDGMEIYCDMDTIAASSPSFLFCARRQLNSYCVTVDRTNNRVQTKVLHLGTGATSSLSNFALAMSGTYSRRFGVTIINSVTQEMQVWYEPYGGGARTILGTWTPATNLFNDALQGGVGMVTGTAVGNTWDNISVVSNATADVDFPTIDETAGDPADPVFAEYGGP